MFVEVSGRRNYEFVPKRQQITMINSFIKKKEKQIGDNWLFEFFLFQFNRYHSKKTRFGEGIVQLSWVIGNKAIQNWKNKKDEELFYVDEFRQKYGLKNILLPKIELRLSSNYLDIKRKSGNLIQCIDLELFDSKNVICRLCTNKEICKNYEVQ